MPNTKIATCCYCGTRAALVLDSGRHELACASCGAPLHELKHLPSTSTKRKPARHKVSHLPESPKKHEKKKHSPKKAKKTKSLGKKAAKGLFDLLEDIFD